VGEEAPFRQQGQVTFPCCQEEEAQTEEQVKWLRNITTAGTTTTVTKANMSMT
jgi:hypothetical protein